MCKRFSVCHYVGEKVNFCANMLADVAKKFISKENFSANRIFSFYFKKSSDVGIK